MRSARDGSDAVLEAKEMSTRKEKKSIARSLAINTLSPWGLIERHRPQQHTPLRRPKRRNFSKHAPSADTGGAEETIATATITISVAVVVTVVTVVVVTIAVMVVAANRPSSRFVTMIFIYI